MKNRVLKSKINALFQLNFGIAFAVSVLSVFGCKSPEIEKTESLIDSFPSVDDTSNIKVKFGDFNKEFQWEIDSQEEAAFIKRLVTENRVVPPKEQLKWVGASRLSFLFPDGEEWVFQTYFRGKQNKLLFRLYDFSAKEYDEHST